MNISAARFFECSLALALISSMSILPSSRQRTTTTLMPAIAALAGLVPCAEDGIRQTVRWPSPRDAVIGADGEQSGIFALAAGIGLQADGVEAGDLRQPAFQFADHGAIACRMAGRREGMQIGDARPAHRHHLGGRIELHGAGAERDHGAVERQVLVGQPAQEAHHLGFRLVLMEHRLGQKLPAARLARHACCRRRYRPWRRTRPRSRRDRHRSRSRRRRCRHGRRR